MTSKKTKTDTVQDEEVKPKRVVKRTTSVKSVKNKVDKEATSTKKVVKKTSATKKTEPLKKTAKVSTKKKHVPIIEDDFAASWLCARAMQNKKAEDILIIDLRNVESSPADFFVLCTCDSSVQVKAVATEVDNQWRKQDWQIGRSEGWDAGEWIILDYFDVVVHVFEREKREFFKLEKLWSDGLQYTITDEGNITEKKVLIKGSKNG